MVSFFHLSLGPVKLLTLEWQFNATTCVITNRPQFLCQILYGTGFGFPLQNSGKVMVLFAEFSMGFPEVFFVVVVFNRKKIHIFLSFPRRGGK